MAGKEATVYIIDVGESMADCHNGREESDLDWSMRYVWEKLGNTVAANRKTWTIGVVGLRTDGTSNPENDEGLSGYEHITIFRDIGEMRLSHLRDLKEQIVPSSESSGDAISAIVVAIKMIETFTKKLKYARKIVLVTDGQTPIDAGNIPDICEKLNEVGIHLTVLGVDFDDADYGVKEEDKTEAKAANEALLKELVDGCNEGAFGTMAEAIEELVNPRIKPTRPYKTYEGPLTLGDPSSYESAASIMIERYFKTHKAIPDSATSIAKSDLAGPSQRPGGADQALEDGIGDEDALKSVRTYQVDDPNEPGGKKDVDFKELARGYAYGSTAVPIGESDLANLAFETQKGFSILGFIPFKSYGPFMNMGATNVIVAAKHNPKAELELSSLINALYELESYAIARFVPKDNKEPQLLLLKPNPKLDGDFECLYDVPLPFAEDVRSYRFAPLDKVVTVTGSVLKEHRLLPSDKLSEAMSDLVDAMDLSTFAKDDEGNPTEYLSIDQAYNPTIHRIKQAILQRAINPDEPLPPVAEVLTRFSKPPEELIEKSSNCIKKVIKLAEVKKVPEKAKFKRVKEAEATLPSEDLDALVAEAMQPATKRPKVSSNKRRSLDKSGNPVANGIPAFKQALEAAGDNEGESIHEAVIEATKEFGEITRKLITDSFASTLYDQAEANIRIMREQLIEYDEPDVFNDFIKALKKSMLSGGLGGDRREMWREHILMRRLGLITKDESDLSDVAVAVAQEFYKSTT